MGFSTPVMVSPTRVSFTFLMDAVNQPTSPADREGAESMPMGRSQPQSSTLYVAPEAIRRTAIPGRMVPSITRNSTMTPR